MPPPSLSTTTMRRSASRARRPSRAFESWAKARSPSRTTDVSPARARPSAVETTPSIPLAPRFACATADPPAEPLQITDRHRRGHREHGTIRERGGDGSGDPRLAEFRLAGERGLDRRIGQRVGDRPGLGPASRSASADGRREEVGHRTHGRHVAVGIDDARAADLDQCGSGRRRPFREHLGTRRSAEADDDVRAVILGEAPIAEQGIGVRDTAGERTHRRHRVGDDRPSGGAVERSDVGRSDPAASTGEDHAPFGIDGGGYRGGRTRPADGRRGPRRLARAVPRPGRGAAHGTAD